MIRASHLALFGAMLLSMGGALFGIGVARALWADDLRRTEELKVYWDNSRTAMESTIDSLRRNIETKDRRIEMLLK